MELLKRNKKMKDLVSPEIVNIKLQPIRLPGGWQVEINHFYELDPDESLDDREICVPRDMIVSDIWNDVLREYFDHSFLWAACRSDHMRSASIVWTPMGDRDGNFEAKLFHNKPHSFQRTPARKIERTHDGEKLSYELLPKVESPVSPVFEMSTRDRCEIVEKLEGWLWQDFIGD